MVSRDVFRERFVADFETTTNPIDCRVWLWGICDVSTDTVIETGTNIQSFCAFLSKRTSDVWFHNLAFDGSFVLDHLLRNGYEHSTARVPPEGMFTTMISEQGKFYAIEIGWGNGHRTTIYDSLKKIPMAVSRIATSFKLPELKGTIDYHAHRPVGYEPTQAEYDYLHNDLVIVSKALNVQREQGLTKMTVGGDALAEYKDVITSKMFDKLFPVLPMYIDDTIRPSYRGGFTYADERFSEVMIKHGQTFDVNSLYPYVMYSCVLPFGHPQYVEDFDIYDYHHDEYPLWIATIVMTASLKPDHIPCIQIKGNFNFKGTEYLKEIGEPTRLAVTSVDWDMWNEHYDIDVQEVHGAYVFEGMSGMFNEYIDKWSAIKADSEGGIREIAKLMLNSLYGKFGTNPDVTGKYPIFDDELDRVRLVLGDQDFRKPIYTAMASFVTAYARAYTVRAGQQHYDRFMYADTDSLHLRGWEPVELDVDPKRMGAWKLEHNFTQAWFQRAKAYTERTTVSDKNGKPFFSVDSVKNENLETHIAGMPAPLQKQVRFKHYLAAPYEYQGKLENIRVPGGIVLRPTTYTLK